MSENSFENNIISKEQLFSIFNEETEVINSLLSQDEKLKKECLIIIMIKKFLIFCYYI